MLDAFPQWPGEQPGGINQDRGDELLQPGSESLIAKSSGWEGSLAFCRMEWLSIGYGSSEKTLMLGEIEGRRRRG